MPRTRTILLRLSSVGKNFLRDAWKTSFALFKITLPASLVVKLLQEAGMVDGLGVCLAPVMHLVGLPGEMGLVWATGLLTNLYGAMVAFAVLAPSLELTTAQVTILTTMLLVAHALPVELRIVQRAGPRLRTIALLRVGGALAIGAILRGIYAAGGWLDRPAQWVSSLAPPDETWLGWARGLAANLVLIFAIILALLVLMKILQRLGAIALLTRLLRPLLTLLGISPSAAPIAIIGMVLGLSYGGGLILRESSKGHLTGRDVFLTLALMSLCHSLIEDTLLMVALGAHTSGVLWARMAFALLATFALAQGLKRLPQRARKWMYRGE
jgi:hypothetical protein